MAKVRTSGLTLAEVIIAVGLIGFVTLGLIGTIVGGLKLMSRSETRTAASNLGAGVIEAISDNGGFHSIPDSILTFDGKTPDPQIDEFPPAPYPGDDRFTTTVRCRVVTPKTRAVQVEVSWRQGSIQLEKVFNEVE